MKISEFEKKIKALKVVDLEDLKGKTIEKAVENYDGRLDLKFTSGEYTILEVVHGYDNDTSIEIRPFSALEIEFALTKVGVLSQAEFDEYTRLKQEAFHNTRKAERRREFERLKKEFEPEERRKDATEKSKRKDN